MVDKAHWSTADLTRYIELLKKVLDSTVLPELVLTDDEVRELERYRLGVGITPYVPPSHVDDQTIGAGTLISEPSSNAVVPAKSNRDGTGPIASQPIEPEPEPCPYCHGPCLGETHHAYATAHYRDPAEVERRTTEAKQRDDNTQRLWKQYGITPPRY